MCDRNNTVDAVGYSAGIILSICLVPQIYKIYKTKQVENISYSWQILYITGISLHLYYAIYYDLLPIYIPTIIELILIIFLFYLTLVYSKREKMIKNNTFLTAETMI
mgnify:FL=1|tara:strand:- start:19 stop:339 length:321 start_codon:yes stop_codon:yes gene_type:complete